MSKFLSIMRNKREKWWIKSFVMILVGIIGSVIVYRMWVKSEELAPLKIDYTYVAIPSNYDQTAVIENPITNYKGEVKSTSADRMSDKKGIFYGLVLELSQT